MNGLDWLPFLGHSSKHPGIEAWLQHHEVKWRPSLRSMGNFHTFKAPGSKRGNGLTVYFSISAQEDGFEVKTDGDFVLCEISFNLLDDSTGVYTGELPLGVNAQDSREQVRQRLGQPARAHESVDIYFIDQLFYFFAFGERMKYIYAQLPSARSRKTILGEPA